MVWNIFTPCLVHLEIPLVFTVDYSRALPGSKLVTNPTAEAEWKAMNTAVNHQEEISPPPYQQLHHFRPGLESCTDKVGLESNSARVRLSQALHWGFDPLLPQRGVTDKIPLMLLMWGRHKVIKFYPCWTQQVFESVSPHESELQKLL